jgi:hypothetical protein
MAFGFGEEIYLIELMIRHVNSGGAGTIVLVYNRILIREDNTGCYCEGPLSYELNFLHPHLCSTLT